MISKRTWAIAGGAAALILVPAGVSYAVTSASDNTPTIERFQPRQFQQAPNAGPVGGMYGNGNGYADQAPGRQAQDRQAQDRQAQGRGPAAAQGGTQARDFTRDQARDQVRDPGNCDGSGPGGGTQAGNFSGRGGMMGGRS